MTDIQTELLALCGEYDRAFNTVTEADYYRLLEKLRTLAARMEPREDVAELCANLRGCAEGSFIPFTETQHPKSNNQKIRTPFFDKAADTIERLARERDEARAEILEGDKHFHTLEQKYDEVIQRAEQAEAKLAQVINTTKFS